MSLYSRGVAIEAIRVAFPQLEILELIGQGGMGVVYSARQPKLDCIVALKILPLRLAREPLFAERFEREGRLLARLNHPNIVGGTHPGVASVNSKRSLGSGPRTRQTRDAEESKASDATDS